MKKGSYDLVGTRTIDAEHLLSILKACNDYSVSLVNGDKLVGSATLVSINGQKGLLTADHVWEVLSKQAKANHFSIVIGNKQHRFEYMYSECTPFVIGKYSSHHAEAGPDLTYVRLDNISKTSTIGSVRSFYPITREKMDIFNALPILKCPLLLWGAPDERTEMTSNADGIPILKLKHWAGNGTFVDQFRDHDFDYIRMSIDSGKNGFPDDYGGLSGGGVWVSYQTADDAKGEILRAPPRLLLIGVAFYQNSTGVDAKQITMHGPESIYMRVPISVAAPIQ